MNDEDIGVGLPDMEPSYGGDPADIAIGGYDQTLEKIAPGINAMIATTATPGEDWTQTLTKLLTAVTMTVQQRQLMQLNIERAKKGLPPIDIASYTGVGVNVGLSPDTMKLVLFGGIALLVILAMRNKS